MCGVRVGAARDMREGFFDQARAVFVAQLAEGDAATAAECFASARYKSAGGPRGRSTGGPRGRSTGGPHGQVHDSFTDPDSRGQRDPRLGGLFVAPAFAAPRRRQGVATAGLVVVVVEGGLRVALPRDSAAQQRVLALLRARGPAAAGLVLVDDTLLPVSLGYDDARALVQRGARDVRVRELRALLSRAY